MKNLKDIVIWKYLHQAQNKSVLDFVMHQAEHWLLIAKDSQILQYLYVVETKVLHQAELCET